MSKHSEYSNRYSYYWSEKKIFILGYIIVPLMGLAMLNIFIDLMINEYNLGSELEINKFSQSIWFYAFMSIPSIFIYHGFICAMHPSYIFSKSK